MRLLWMYLNDVSYLISKKKKKQKITVLKFVYHSICFVLFQDKRQLESEFHRLQAHGMATIDDHNPSAHDTSFTGQSNRTGVNFHCCGSNICFITSHSCKVIPLKSGGFSVTIASGGLGYTTVPRCGGI